MKLHKTLRIVILCAVCAALAAAILYLVPWPTRIDTEMYCAKVTEDGQVLAEGTAQLKGWQLNYLFQGDRFILQSLELPGHSYTQQNKAQFFVTAPNAQFPFWYAGGMIYNEQKIGFDIITICTDSVWQNVFITIEDGLFACSVNADIPIRDILDAYG